MNPLTVLPAKARKYVYALLTLAALIYGAYQASDGDWLTALGSVLVSLTGGMATANVTPDTNPDGGEGGEIHPDVFNAGH